MNAVDLANKCGTPLYAVASGMVQRAVFNNACQTVTLTIGYEDK
jgi:murein DD-endopeptidase MepM/ murein hydrolase activator NlpD